MADDRILLHGIRFHGHHGISEEERRVGGRFSVDVEIARDLEQASRDDDVERTVDYRLVHEIVIGIGARQSYRLIETLGRAVGEAIMERTSAESVRVVVRKEVSMPSGPVSYAAVDMTFPRSSR